MYFTSSMQACLRRRSVPMNIQALIQRKIQIGLVFHVEENVIVKKSSNIGLKTSENNDHFENMTKFLDTIPSFPTNIMNTFSSKNSQNLDDNNGIDLHSSFDPRTDIKSDVITKAKSHHANYIYKNFK